MTMAFLAITAVVLLSAAVVMFGVFLIFIFALLLHCDWGWIALGTAIRNLVIFEVAAHLGDLKPLHISDRLASSRDRVVHCVFDAVWRGTDQLNLFVDVVTHKRIKPLHVASGEHIH
jgi:hypothetical protein